MRPEYLDRFDLLFDVGANVGQYAQKVFDMGYRGRIVSFEPVSTAHEKLVAAAAGNPRWIVAPRMALGATVGEAMIHVSGNAGVSSSALEMLDTHLDACPTSGYVNVEFAPRETLDDMAELYRADQAKGFFVKLDVQGYELAVLEGGFQRALRLQNVSGVELELSVVPLYEGSPSLHGMFVRLNDLEFWCDDLEPEFTHPVTGKVLQYNGIFLR